MKGPEYTAHCTAPESSALIIALHKTAYDIVSLGWRDHAAVFPIVSPCGGVGGGGIF